MTKEIVYFHSLSSPWAYLGGPELHRLIKKHDLKVHLRPTTILEENGGIPLRSRPDARQEYHELELDRWRKRLNIPLALRPAHYPANPEFSARMVIAADTLGWNALRLSHALLRALWSEERDILDAAVRVDVANTEGMNGARLLEMQESDEVQALWEQSHAEASAAGVFGTPTYVFEGERFWGQDRLTFLDERLSERS
ncbi:2-hydroxychromene-2-carboxylate isomerase [Falsihalocynthiibacter arcticus]|uniref:2-hydroxychromene-2-carboxylate isomerase n=1 Tax=Falsihalocynthiibacter arcticus TaxID=1579316 RepID=A0A126V1N4_9RHOB|nr:DsbA family protein [Falsihalocynthiibacter arcticus]AML51855.1 2-hydroxychromene-2-carboxylate isomerase [Falsihalocynthiibacter arcticus]